MFKFGPKTETPLDKAIIEVHREMATVNADSDEFAKMVKQLSKLYALKEKDSPKRVSPDTRANILSNIAIVAVIVGYERSNVIATKALSFVGKF